MMICIPNYTVSQSSSQCYKQKNIKIHGHSDCLIVRSKTENINVATRRNGRCGEESEQLSLTGMNQNYLLNFLLLGSII